VRVANAANSKSTVEHTAGSPLRRGTWPTTGSRTNLVAYVFMYLYAVGSSGTATAREGTMSYGNG
jgi:hypothetical protein